jgi:hypothetical protein
MYRKRVIEESTIRASKQVSNPLHAGKTSLARRSPLSKPQPVAHDASVGAHAPAAVVMDADHPAVDLMIGRSAPELRALLRTGGIFQHLLRHPAGFLSMISSKHSPKAILASRLLPLVPLD